MAGKNTLVRDLGVKSLFESAKNVIGTSTTFDQGDLLIYDATSKLLVKPTLEADCATVCGISRISILNGKVVSPYNTDVVASQSVSDVGGPQYNGIFKMVLKTGDSCAAGGLAYFNPATGARGVTVTGTKAIGIFQQSITGAAAGTEVEVLIGARFPEDSLSF